MTTGLRQKNWKKIDRAIVVGIERLSKNEDDYWSFRTVGGRKHAHALFQYPAMMVPEMQGKLIGLIQEVSGTRGSVLDPFMGSGTVLTESMLLNSSFYGQDINPLAYLVCSVKSSSFDYARVEAAAIELLGRVRRSRSDKIAVDFPGLYKWFACRTAIALSRIYRAIVAEPQLEIRRFFWVAMAETVRRTSNSRMSTFKLHIRTPEDIARRDFSTTEVFERVLKANIDKLQSISQLLSQKRLLSEFRFKKPVRITVGDSSSEQSQLHQAMSRRRADMLVTSPPYGDNQSTIPYGQHSFLPLQWISLSDIEARLAQSCLQSTHEIDARSLGGSRRDAQKRCASLYKNSRAFASAMQALQNEPADRQSRLGAFCSDLDRSLAHITTLLKPNAYMVWTLGNRRIAGRAVPIDNIVSELLQSRGATEITRVTRSIPSKRMAHRNNVGSTMLKETVLILRNGSQ